MPRQAIDVTDRTNAADAVGFLLDKLAPYDLHLLDWVRVSPMTDAQHKPPPGGDCPAITLSTCWKPRDGHATEPPLPKHMYRIKVNVWQGKDYPAQELNWGRIPPRPIRRRRIAERYTTRGICKWHYPDRKVATVHALARAFFLFLANTGQVAQNPSDSNASAWGHRWAAEWMRCHGQEGDATAMLAQLMQWTLIQSKKI